jgi:hypothetical protein
MITLSLFEEHLTNYKQNQKFISTIKIYLEIPQQDGSIHGLTSVTEFNFETS